MNKQGLMLKISAFVLTGILCLPSLPAFAENEENKAEAVPAKVSVQQAGDYSEYLSAHNSMSFAAEDILVDLSAFDEKYVSASFSVPKDALYELELSYSAVSDKYLHCKGLEMRLTLLANQFI